MTNNDQKTKGGVFQKFLDHVEKIGNKLPHPVTLFFILAIVVIFISYICEMLGVSVTYEVTQKAEDGTIATIEQTVAAVSLLSAEGIRYIFSTMVTNFTGFAPLGTVLVAMLGIGVAEGTGLIEAALKKAVVSTPKKLITVMVVFLGIMSNIASDAGYVVLVPLGAVIFLSFGRHPLAGLAAAFAGVSGGFSANLLLGPLDPLLGGISTEAANIMAPGYTVQPTANWYFMIASTFLITVLGTIVTERIIEPRLGEYKGRQVDTNINDITSDEKKGLKAALVSMLVFIGVILALLVPEGAILRNPETGEILRGSAFMAGIVPIIALLFMIPGLFYGIFAKTIKNDKDVAKFMGKAMSSMGGYLVIAFAASQFIAFFNYSKLGIILAVTGADFLETIGLSGIPLMVGFVIIAAFINLFVGSASAKWAIMAPIFVPMFMRLGYSPELTQLAYRIGDSTTNIITPLMSYFAVIVAFAEQYDEETGIGTLISMMLPYSLVFLAGWILLMIIWLTIGLPIGPGTGIYFSF
ncbi:MAG: AbgT family transporter [Deferribacterales bacterium]|nr:AbgT family transporter [Deferribacterales bacterium]